MSRDDLLLKMYDQMFNDINRHIMVVWQSVGVLVGAFAVFALVEKNVVPLDFAVCIVLLLALWLMAHLFDAAYWYNRNLVIIANIERQFLRKEDLKEIHYYFGSHRPSNKMIYHLRIQMTLGIALTLMVLSYHFYIRVVPGLDLPLSNISLVRCLPYLLTIAAALYLLKLKNDCKKKYEEFLRESPGKTIDTTGTSFGIGHGH
ncbi:DNA-binding response regulator [Pseudomonas monteilii]|uniref:DNA-binding response regulator n=1 Tax=Pseudomonas monteilii TaxID=76759 RepID=A0AAE6R7R4_9PSED|nr:MULTISPECIES: hypothetical protein [Pseudomonas]QHB25978.1 DNA-binding response regulator [Pseudomonas monteilii]QJQ19039.1 hypothetical protein HG549_03475 [Pseudomonas sp. SK]